ncbi:Tryptophan-rich antigen [Plasmodium coatneyi]|uniref:Tryptophan-rich antigen n=1 Tax=Plasmodium coatneyi TaxID=208452 RepID=A0A1B1DXR6_9APIC|nr:Tryptophan-rich antigen [Plasmodium coatneyi]ANQ07576.1 Tryptophan-rich antigen [Plasmodium coatneyi]
MKVAFIILYIFSVLLDLSLAVGNLKDFLDGSAKEIEGLTHVTLNDTSEGTEKVEEWVKDEWREWMDEMQMDWNEFNNYLESEKNKWFGKKEKEMIKFIKSIEDIWLHFNENMNEMLSYGILRNSLMWTFSEWQERINNDGKRIIEDQWDNWTTSNQTLYYKLIMKEWFKWKNKKIKQWLKRNWLHHEGRILENWERMPYTKILAMSEKKPWFNSNAQIINEQDSLLNWIKKKEDFLVSEERNKWKNWEYYKNNFFQKWMDSFLSHLLNLKKQDIFKSISNFRNPPPRNLKLYLSGYLNDGVSVPQNTKHIMLSYFKPFSAVPRLILALFLLSLFFCSNEASAAFRAVLDQSISYLSNALESAQQPETRSDQWRQNEWNKWEDKLEEEWEEFDENLEEEKDELLKMNEEEWGPWFEEIKKKWTTNFGKNLDDEYKLEVLKESLYWNEVTWKTWIKTEGRAFIQKDLVKWIASKESYLYRWVSKEWTEWKNEKIQEWFNSKWKREENEYWTKWEKKFKQSKNSSKMINSKDHEKWLKWKETTQHELNNWHEWAEFKDNIYINSDWAKWKQWKNTKRTLFYDWVDSYVYKWIREQQWTALIDEIKELVPLKNE